MAVDLILTFVRSALAFITLLFLGFGMARISFASPTLTDVGKDPGLYTTKLQNAIKAIGKTQLPVSEEITKDRQALVLFTAGAAYTEVVAIAKPEGDAREIADALAGGLRGTELDAIELRYGQSEGLAVVVGNVSHGHFGADSAETKLSIREIGNAFRVRGWDVTVVVRAGKYGERTAVGMSQDEGPNWMWFSARDFEAASSVSVKASLTPLLKAAFYCFLFGPWALCALGLIAAMIVGKRESIPVKRRRVLYTRLAMWPTFGSMGLHAPLAIWFLAGRGFRPFADLWFGTSSSVALIPFIAAPLILLILLVPLNTVVERKLFGPDPDEPEALIPQLSPEEMEVKKRSRRLGLVIAFAGLGFYIATIPLDRKNEVIGILRIAVFGLALFGSSIAEFVFRRRLRSFDVTVEDPQLEAMVQKMASEMGVTVKKVEIDGKELGRQFPNASASAADVVTLTARLRDILEEDELRSVVAHELAHLKLRHPHRRRNLHAGIFLVATVAAIILVAVNQTGSFTSGRLAMLVMVVPFVVMVFVFLAAGPSFRRQEYAADRLMLETTRDLDAAVSALEKMVRNSEAPHVHEMEVGMHPAMSKRIEQLRAIAAELGLSSSKTA